MPTLTNQQIQNAYRMIEMIGQQDLPIKVSYALTRTKNKRLEPEIKSFREETEELEQGSPEIKDHLQHEVEVEVHNVSADHLEGEQVPPSLFAGLTFIFPEESKTEEKEVEVADIVGALNVFSQMGENECSSSDVIFQIARAIEVLRRESGDINEQLQDFNNRLEELDDGFEGNPGEEVPGERQEIIDERQEFLGETRVIESPTVQLDALMEEEDLSIAPAALEAIDPFLEA
jgi:hypothetical protein